MIWLRLLQNVRRGGPYLPAVAPRAVAKTDPASAGDEDDDEDEKPARKPKARKQSTAEAIEADVAKVRKSVKPD